QTETEATGAPQKHHYTLNQQVGSITTNLRLLPAKNNNNVVARCFLLKLFNIKITSQSRLYAG
ncbi:hypothetical protein ACQE8M_23260, partial [Klebsiella pneumoniae]